MPRAPRKTPESLLPQQFSGLRASRFLICLMALMILAQPALAASKAEADAFKNRLMAALPPYLNSTHGEGKWSFAMPLSVQPAETGGGFKVTAEELAYHLPLKNGSEAKIDLGRVVFALAPSGANWNMTAQLSDSIRLIADGQVKATIASRRAQLSGLWLTEREAFQRLESIFDSLQAEMANGDRITIETLRGVFSSREAGMMSGTLDATGYKGRKAVDATLLTLTTARIEIDLRDLDRATGLWFNMRYTAPPPSEAGAVQELAPLRLSLKSNAKPFPWRNVLLDLPEFFSGGHPDPYAQVWERIKLRLSQAASLVQLSESEAKSTSLLVTGSGQAHFKTGGSSNGSFLFNLRGINDRISALSKSGQADRRKSLETFGVLALLAAVGEGVNQDGERFHRFRFDMKPDGSFLLNGHDLSSIMAKKP
jgi:hypothetical protein